MSSHEIVLGLVIVVVVLYGMYRCVKNRRPSSRTIPGAPGKSNPLPPNSAEFRKNKKIP